MTARMICLGAYGHTSLLIVTTLVLALFSWVSDECRAQFPPVNPPLAVTGEITAATFYEREDPDEWHPLEHGAFVHWGTLCRGTADAIVNNNEEFTVTFWLGAAINVAGGDELDEVENPWGNGTRKVFEKNSPLAFNTSGVSAPPLAQGLELHVETSEVTIPRFVVVPGGEFSASSRRLPMRPKHRTKAYYSGTRETFCAGGNTAMKGWHQHACNQWEVKVVNYAVALNAYDTATGTLSKNIDGRWDQFIAGEILE